MIAGKCIYSRFRGIRVAFAFLFVFALHGNVESVNVGAVSRVLEPVGSHAVKVRYEWDFGAELGSCLVFKESAFDPMGLRVQSLDANGLSLISRTTDEHFEVAVGLYEGAPRQGSLEYLLVNIGAPSRALLFDGIAHLFCGRGCANVFVSGPAEYQFNDSAAGSISLTVDEIGCSAKSNIMYNVIRYSRIPFSSENKGGLVHGAAAAQPQIFIEWTTNLLDPSSWTILRHDAVSEADADSRRIRFIAPNGSSRVYYRLRASEGGSL
jgi:hypothetical protein